MWCLLFLRHLVNVVKSTLLETWNFPPHGFNCCYQVIGITVWTDSWFPPTWDPIVERNGKCVAFWKKRLFFLIGNDHFYYVYTWCNKWMVRQGRHDHDDGQGFVISATKMWDLDGWIWVDLLVKLRWNWFHTCFGSLGK